MISINGFVTNYISSKTVKTVSKELFFENTWESTRKIWLIQVWYHKTIALYAFEVSDKVTEKIQKQRIQKHP